MKALSRLRFGRLLVAGFAFLVIAVGNPAPARATLIASYASGLTNDYELTTSGGTTNFQTIGGLAVGTSGVSFVTFNPAASPLGVVTASMKLTATSTAAAGSAGGLDFQVDFSGSYEIRALVAGGYGPAGTLLLSATFSHATLSGSDGGNTIQFSDSTATDSTLVVTAPSATIAPPESFSFSLVDLTAAVGLTGGSPNQFNPFKGSDAQTQAATIVPEPSSVVIAGIGALGMMGYGLRRRKALGA